MAAFLHDNRHISYEIALAPFAHDVLLLHASDESVEFWRSVLRGYENDAPAGGRFAVCDWFEDGLDTEALSRGLAEFIKTLGLHSLRIVACGDAVPVVQRLEKHNSDLIDKTLFYAQSIPTSHELARAIREFSQT